LRYEEATRRGVLEERRREQMSRREEEESRRGGEKSRTMIGEGGRIGEEEWSRRRLDSLSTHTHTHTYTHTHTHTHTRIKQHTLVNMPFLLYRPCIGPHGVHGTVVCGRANKVLLWVLWFVLQTDQR
jgi:hypothetical protein